MFFLCHFPEFFLLLCPCVLLCCAGVSLVLISGAHFNSPVASANVCVPPFVHFALKLQPNRHILYAIWRKFKYFPSFLLFSFTVFHFESLLVAEWWRLSYLVAHWWLVHPRPVFAWGGIGYSTMPVRLIIVTGYPLLPHFHLVAHQFKDLCLRF